VLNGIFISLKEGKMTLVATDGRRLALVDEEVDISEKNSGEFIVPKKAVDELNRLLQAKGEVEIKFGENQASFSLKDDKGLSVLLITKLIEGNYPNYRQVIPGEAKERVPIDREEFLQALRRAEIMTSEKANSVKLTFSKNNLTITANATLTDNNSVTVGSNASLDDQGALTIAANATLTDNNSVTVASNAYLDDEGTLTVAPNASLTEDDPPNLTTPPNVMSTSLNPQETAVADTATQISVATFGPVLQSLLTTQGFSAANNWTLNTTAVTLNPNALFNIKQYNLTLNPAGNAFGEVMSFTLNPNLAGPTNVPAGSTVTEHWLQILNESYQVNGFGYSIAGQQGFWKLDNGNQAGGAAAGAGTGPYYDSNAPPGALSVPPTFSDSPEFYSGVGFYFHADTIPTWDVL